MQRSAVALLQVINDILDFSKIEAGMLDVESIDFDLRALLDETVADLRERRRCQAARARGARRRRGAGLRARRPGRVRQVLSNLISNAIKFTERGEIVVEVGVVSAGADDTLLRMSVRDTGIGIDAELCQRIFDPFTQADGSTTRRYGGTGLGLAISRQLVQMMGGEIGVTSTPQVGSRFSFTVRVGRSAEGGAALAPVLAGHRVLVVDDNPTNLEILRCQLASGAMFTHGVCSAAEALEALAAASPPVRRRHPRRAHAWHRRDGACRTHPQPAPLRRTAHRHAQLDQLRPAAQTPARLDISGSLTKPVGAAQLLRVIEQALGATPACAAAPAPVRIPRPRPAGRGQRRQPARRRVAPRAARPAGRCRGGRQ
jgi:anti-sigma regulatory factor (Ser/Thr protein kinase)